MRHEASFLKDILAAIRNIEAITSSTTEEQFVADEVLSAAILRHLTVIGEAIKSSIAGTQGAELWSALAPDRGCEPQNRPWLLRSGLGDSLERPPATAG